MHAQGIVVARTRTPESKRTSNCMHAQHSAGRRGACPGRVSNIPPGLCPQHSVSTQHTQCLLGTILRTLHRTFNVQRLSSALFPSARTLHSPAAPNRNVHKYHYQPYPQTHGYAQPAAAHTVSRNGSVPYAYAYVCLQHSPPPGCVRPNKSSQALLGAGALSLALRCKLPARIAVLCPAPCIDVACAQHRMHMMRILIHAQSSLHARVAFRRARLRARAGRTYT